MKETYNVGAVEYITFPCDSKEAVICSHYTLLSDELNNSRDFFELLKTLSIKKIEFKEQKNPDTILAFSLFIAAIIFYGRAFNTSDSRTHLSEGFYKGKNKDIHKELMNLRNQYIAHSGTSDWEYCETRIAINPVIKSPPEVMSPMRRLISLESFKIEQYIDLIEHALEKVQLTINCMTAKIKKEAECKMDEFYSQL